MSTMLTRRPRVEAAATEVRLGWALSPAGRVAACKVLDSAGRLTLERRWPFTGTPRARAEVNGLAPQCELFPEDDGSVTVATHVGPDKTLYTWSSHGEWVRWRDTATAPDRLQRGPGGSVDSCAAISGGTLVTRRCLDTTVELARVPFRVLGCQHVGSATLILNVVGDGGYGKAVRVDLTSGEVEDFFTVSARSDDRVLAVRGGVAVVSTNAAGETRVGWGTLQENRIRFPEAGCSDRAMGLVAMARDGSRAVLVEDRGLTMPLRLVDLRTGAWRPLPTPPLLFAGPGTLDQEGLVVPIGDLTHPGTVLRVSTQGHRPVTHDDPPVGPVGTTGIVQVPGPAGPIEALVVGEPSTAAQVVVVLHGGPYAAWRSAHNVLFDELATHGIAVVAPNIRGSIGYGRAHADAIRGRWGDVDAQDVLAVAEWVRAARPAEAAAPVVVGESYGAYLALLSAATAPPRTWAACAALSGFTSGRQVLTFGNGVADLVRRFGGETSPDLLTLAGRLDVPVLLVHGEQDDVVPVTESLALGAALSAAGVEVQVVTDPVAGHDLLCSPDGPAHRRRLIAFVRAAVGRADLVSMTSAGKEVTK